MSNLFGQQSELDKLRDLDYKTESHTFSKGVIAAYYNGMEYPMSISKETIGIKRRKGYVFFLNTPEKYQQIFTNLTDIHGTIPKTLFGIDLEKDTIYSLIKTSFTKKKTKEVIYDLDKIFTNPSKQVRRGINLLNRKEVSYTTDCRDKQIIDKIYSEWSQCKIEDPKVFRIAFTPKRYLRSFDLQEKGFNTINLIYTVKGEPYGALCYEIQDNIAFELAFISRFWRKDLKIINDLNELILIHSFYLLWKVVGIKKINVGPTAGIKGLKIFKSKLPSEELIIYSN